MKPLPTFIFNLIANIFYSKQFLFHIQEELKSIEGMKLLDAPCGTGIILKFCKPLMYVGIDIDIKRVIDAKHKYPSENFIVGDASGFCIKDNKFDGVLSLGLFHHVNDETSNKILAEFKRVLNFQGKVIVIEAIWPRRWYNVVGFIGRKLDQGTFVRSAEEFEILFQQHFRIEKKIYFSNFGLEYLLTTLIYN